MSGTAVATAPTSSTTKKTAKKGGTKSTVKGKGKSLKSKGTKTVSTNDSFTVSATKDNAPKKSVKKRGGTTKKSSTTTKSSRSTKSKSSSKKSTTNKSTTRKRKGGRPKSTLIPFAREVFSRAAKLMSAKQKDYATPQEELRNFIDSSQFASDMSSRSIEFTPEDAINFELGLKISRLKNLGDRTPMNESKYDTYLDIINYFVFKMFEEVLRNDELKNFMK